MYEFSIHSRPETELGGNESCREGGREGELRATVPGIKLLNHTELVGGSGGLEMGCLLACAFRELVLLLFFGSRREGGNRIDGWVGGWMDGWVMGVLGSLCVVFVVWNMLFGMNHSGRRPWKEAGRMDGLGW